MSPPQAGSDQYRRPAIDDFFEDQRAHVERTLSDRLRRLHERIWAHEDQEHGPESRP